MTTGRPSTYSDDIAATICERIAEGRSLRSICTDEDMPAASTVFKWLTQQQSFAEQYARAREAQADTLFDEILEIADDGTNDYTTDKQGNEIVNSEHIQRSRLRVDARKWMAGKLRPKVYGDRVINEHAGEVSVKTMNDEELNARLAELVGETGSASPSGGKTQA